MSLNILFGVVLIVATAAMVWVARPAEGQDSASFLRVWFVGQIYALACLIFAIVGIGIIILNWPA